MRNQATGLVCGFVTLAILAGSSPVRGVVAIPVWNRAKAATYLAGRASAWLSWSGSARGNGTACISCHTGLPLSLSLAALSRSAGGDQAKSAEELLVTDVEHRVADWNTISSTHGWQAGAAQCFYGDKQPSSLGTESVMNALVLTNFERSRSAKVLPNSTRQALKYLWQQQQPDGSWQWLEFGLSPWEHDGVYYGAALAGIAVGMAGPAYYDSPAVRPNVTALRAYLKHSINTVRLHDATVCLLASTWLPGILTRDQQAGIVQRLAAIQNTDGGWSLHSLGTVGQQPSQWGSPGFYPNDSTSDGYATGLIVLTLKRLALPASKHTVAMGVQWLSAHEHNGSWPANYINGMRDPKSMEGKFMRDAATSFAVLALQQK